MAVLRFSKATLLKVLAFTAVSAVFTVALAIKIGNLQLFAHTYTLDAQFANAAGVFKGDAVKLAGVDVGSVQGTRIENGLGVVAFKVDDSVKIPRDSIFAIRWRNVLGQRFIYIYPGTHNGKFLSDGDVVSAAHTQDAGDLGQFLNDLGPILRAINPDKANAFLDAMNTALAGNSVGVRQLLDDGAVLAGRLGSMDRQIKTLVGTSNTVMSTYAKQNHSIAKILDHLNVLGIRLNSMKGDVDSVIVNFADVQQQLDRVLRNSRGNIDASLSELQSLVALLAHNSQSLQTTLCTLPAGLAGYFQTTSWGEWFNVRITKFMLKDRNGKTRWTSGETSQQRSKHATPAYTHCAGSTSSSTSRGSGGKGGHHGGKGGKKGGGGLPTPSLPVPTTSLPVGVPQHAGFGNVGDLVRSVLAGTREGGARSA